MNKAKSFKSTFLFVSILSVLVLFLLIVPVIESFAACYYCSEMTGLCREVSRGMSECEEGESDAGCEVAGGECAIE